MAYRIRYGEDARRFRWVRVPVIVSLVLLAAVVLNLWLGGGEAVRTVFCPGETVLAAMEELVRAVSGGEGWYQGLARFCGRIINGTA